MAKVTAQARALGFLVRRGQAEDRHALGDEARALTAEGCCELRAPAQELRGELDLVGIATSPLVRAVQTAESLAEAGALDSVIVRAELGLGPASGTGIAS